MRIEEFLSKVCDQVRCKKAQPLVLEELKAHIEDQKQAYESEGLEAPLAEQRAVQEMGDPVLVGEQLNHAHRPKPEWGIIGLMLLISVLGIIVQTVLLSGEAQTASTAWTSYILIGFALTMLMYFLDFTVIGRYPAAVFLTVILVGWAVCRNRIPLQK